MPAKGSGVAPLNRPTMAVSAKVMRGSIKRAPAAGMAKSRMRWPVVCGEDDDGSLLRSLALEGKEDDEVVGKSRSVSVAGRVGDMMLVLL